MKKIAILSIIFSIFLLGCSNSNIQDDKILVEETIMVE